MNCSTPIEKNPVCGNTPMKNDSICCDDLIPDTNKKIITDDPLPPPVSINTIRLTFSIVLSWILVALNLIL